MLYPLDKSISFLITFILVHSLGLTAVRANELSDQMVNPIEVIDIKPSNWSYRSFQSLVKRYDCLSASAETTFDGISQIGLNLPKISIFAADK
jgi:hypothetical protein